ncbi:MAG: hypothetical protein ACOYUZ_03995 [Patescibacteria group bacterium]
MPKDKKAIFALINKSLDTLAKLEASLQRDDDPDAIMDLMDAHAQGTEEMLDSVVEHLKAKDLEKCRQCDAVDCPLHPDNNGPKTPRVEFIPDPDIDPRSLN